MAAKWEEQMREITQRLEQGVQQFFNSENYTAYLDCMRQFHNYSFNNTILIAMQKPDATLVAGYQAWQKKFDRYVKKGEKGIQIIAPAPIKEKEEREKIDKETGEVILKPDGRPEMEEVEYVIPRFRVSTVFDVSQTDGEPLPSLGAEELTASVENYDVFMRALEAVADVPIRFEEIGGSAKGYYDSTAKEIVIQAGMSQSQTLKTGIHETAHSILHDKDWMQDQGIQKDQMTREVEAESVAYTVCQHFGVDTSDYSFPYVASWSSGRDMKELRASMDTIRHTASDMIDAITEQIQILQREQTVDLGYLPDDTRYAKVELYGQPALFSNGRIEENRIPVGLYRYDLRGSDYDPGRAATLEPNVTANHAGTIITATLLPVPPHGFLRLGAGLSFDGGEMTMEEYKRHAETALYSAQADSFGIYQLLQTEENAQLRFMSSDYLEQHNITIAGKNYGFLYGDVLAENEDLNSIYEKFNLTRPEDFRGHSLSVSDVVVVQRNGVFAAYYVDSFGFKELPDFVLERSAFLAPDLPPEITMETSGLTIDGHEGTWHSAEMCTIQREPFFRMMHDEFGTEVGSVIVTQTGIPVAEDIWNGFDRETIPAIQEYFKERYGIEIEEDEILADLERSGVESNFRIEETTNHTFVVRSDSERFGKDEIVFESHDRNDCLSYISDRRPERQWRYYIIPDLHSWADRDLPHTGIEYYNTFEEAKERFDELYSDSVNQPAVIGNTGLPVPRLTLGVDCLTEPSAADILHIRGGHTALVDDFTRLPNLNTDGKVLDMLAEVTEKIDIEKVLVADRNADGTYSAPRLVDYDDWFRDQPYIAIEETEQQPQSITVLKIAPNQYPEVVEIVETLEELQSAVGGDIEVVYPYSDAVGIVCWDEGKLSGEKLNRGIRNEENVMYDAIAGTFLVVGLGEEGFASLSPELLEKYKALFHQPEMFVINRRETIAIPIPDEFVGKNYPPEAVIPVYPYSAGEAKEYGELPEYRLSRQTNIACKEAIEGIIRDNFDGMHLKHHLAASIMEQYGSERVMYVLASTVQMKAWDERFSVPNREWAKSADTVPEMVDGIDRRYEFAVNSHPAVLDGFISQAREEATLRELVREAMKNSEPLDVQMAVETPKGYFTVQITNDGYDYSFFNKDYSEVDGGVVDDPAMTPLDVVRELLDDEGIRASRCKAANYTTLICSVDEKAKEQLAVMEKEAHLQQLRKMQPFISDRTEPMVSLNGDSCANVEQIVLDYAQQVLAEQGLDEDVFLLGARVYGSRSREGLSGDGSDLDVVISYTGEMQEDDFFNALHEKTFSISGILVDMNPISIEKTGTLDNYMTKAEIYLDEKAMRTIPQAISMEPKIVFSVAETSEFPVMGEYHTGLTLQEALVAFEQIPQERMNGVKQISFQIEDDSIFSGRTVPLLEGNQLNTDIIDAVNYYRENPLVQNALSEMRAYLDAQNRVEEKPKEVAVTSEVSRKNEKIESEKTSKNRKDSVLNALRQRQTKLKEKEQTDQNKGQSRKKGEQSL